MNMVWSGGSQQTSGIPPMLPYVPPLAHTLLTWQLHGSASPVAVNELLLGSLGPFQWLLYPSCS